MLDQPNQAKLGLVLQTTATPPDCGSPNGGRQGYGGTALRDPENTKPIPPNVSARCTAPVSSGTDVRGSANVPGGDPISATGGGVAYPRTATGDTVSTNTYGTSLMQPSDLGDASWLALLTDGLH